MSVPQISALARAAEAASAEDPGEQGLLMMRVRELEKLMRDAHAHDLASCLSAAASLAELLSKTGDVTRADVHEGTCRILRAVELAFSGGVSAGVRKQATSGDSLPLINDMVLGQILMQLGHVSDQQLRAALSLQQQTGKRIGDILVDAGVTERDVVEAAHRIQKRLRQEASQRNKQGAKPDSESSEKPLSLDKSGLRISDPPEPPGAGTLRRQTNDYLLGQILVQMGIVKNKQVEQAGKDARATGTRIGEALVRASFCRWEDIQRAMKVQVHLRRMAGVEGIPSPEARRA